MTLAELFPTLRLFLLRQDVRFTKLALRRLQLRNKSVRDPIIEAHGPVLSMTTHGKRVATVYLALESIAEGSILPSRVLLWLDDERGFVSRPDSLRTLEDRGLEIKLTENWGPHTKYYPYLRSTDTFRLPLVTADDDTLYPRNWLADLVKAFDANSTVINCHRAHILRLEGGEIAPYLTWERCRSSVPSFLHFATGCAGCVYPQAFLEELKAAGTTFLQLCPQADDMWLHVNAIRAGYKIKQVRSWRPEFPLLPGTQDLALFLSNGSLLQNDVQLRNTYSSVDLRFLEAHRGVEARRRGLSQVPVRDRQ